MCIRDRYKPVVTAAISEDVAYRNACGHSDRENAVIAGNAAVRRVVLGSKDMELIRLCLLYTSQKIELFDKPGLFSTGRIVRDNLPEGVYCYDPVSYTHLAKLVLPVSFRFGRI